MGKSWASSRIFCCWGGEVTLYTGLVGGGALSGLIIGAGNSLIQGNSANQIMIDAAGGAMMGALMAPVGALIGGKIGNLMMKTRFGKAIGAWYSHHSKGLFFDKNNSLSPFFKAVRRKIYFSRPLFFSR